MAYWLVKSEPDVYSIEDMERDRLTAWEGVRNYEARNHLRAMKAGDLALFYHSSSRTPAAVGVVEVAREAYPDPAQFDPASPYHDPKSPREAPRWVRVDLRFVRRLPRPLAAEEARALPALKDMALLKRGRLSVQPVTPSEWKAVLRAADAAAPA